uniref:LINE-1 retrotransposable element ORF1 protein n=1 Tax=Papio anubis TaxID=9555 RepID=A0A2I3M040_PAPAN
MGKKQGRKAGNSKNKSTSPPAKERSSSPATDQSWTENDFDEMREEGFSPSNFSELKEELRTQRKETKNLEKKVEELTARLINAEKVINEMKEMKTMTREIRDKCTSFSNRLDQLEERVSAIEDQMNEMKREEKPKEKRRKRNEQSLQEVWHYVKRPNLRLIGVPESEGENGTKLENTLQDIIQENFPNLVGQANIQIQEIQRTPQRYSSRRATPRHIIARFTKVEMKEKILRAAREKGRVTHKGKPIRLTADLSQEIQRTPQRYSSRRATPRHIIVRFTKVEMKEKMLRAAREKGWVTHKGKPIRLTADLLAETLQARREHS